MREPTDAEKEAAMNQLLVQIQGGLMIAAMGGMPALTQHRLLVASAAAVMQAHEVAHGSGRLLTRSELGEIFDAAIDSVTVVQREQFEKSKDEINAVRSALEGAGLGSHEGKGS